jgi:hypothetical protein
MMPPSTLFSMGQNSATSLRNLRYSDSLGRCHLHQPVGLCRASAASLDDARNLSGSPPSGYVLRPESDGSRRGMQIIQKLGAATEVDFVTGMVQIKKGVEDSSALLQTAGWT